MKIRAAGIILVLLMACLIPLSVGLAQERTNLGTITLPRDAEFPAEDENGPMTASLPKGEYRLNLFQDADRMTIVLVSEESGSAFGCPTEVKEISENYAEPKSEVRVVIKDGQDFIQIVVFKGNKQATSLMNCSS